MDHLTPDEAKSAARALRRSLAASGIDISHAQALEHVAHQLGFRDWNTATAQLSRSRGGMGPAVPLLRIQDEDIARRFYVDHLGFAVEWEHRFSPGMPLYARLRRGATTLDLTEHHTATGHREPSSGYRWRTSVPCTPSS
ncbi:glyoxalase superfamily protein [Brachybacterium saurashtrense]|uniref:glyoxalase superfamily protein n=1 Tax=Brachybacterium saurashtrense TaxID=556288 RepID=UPI002407B669|nr:glyoxalase superfamily protein [Brachybacterium saurashtrense]